MEEAKHISTGKKGEKIAQLVITKHEIVKVTEVDDLSSTERGSGGFNSTGIK